MLLPLERMMQFDIKTIHIIGIGGIGMSGIAEILVSLGYKVQGSDLKASFITEKLQSMGLKIFLGHEGSNVHNADLVVKSSAIGQQNSEIHEAEKLGITVITRAEMLAEIMRSKVSIAVSGTHGKTTTTSLVGAMLEHADLAPTVITGGIINSKATNAYMGKSSFLVAEADESDATFIKLPATISVITNINPEHLDYYGDFENLKRHYRIFVENLPFYGLGVLCIDHPEVAALARNIDDKNIVTYGIENEKSDVRATNIRQFENYFLYDAEVNSGFFGQSLVISDIYLPCYGLHNVLNSLAAVVVGLKLKISPENIKNGFKNFSGVGRRFTKTGEVNNIIFIDDYAHHPVEIAATLKAAKSLKKQRILAVFQPHRYSRVQSLFEEYGKVFHEKLVDILFITDIFASNEAPIFNVNRENLAQLIRKNNPNLLVVETELNGNLTNFLSKYVKEGDLVIFLGAGNITHYANIAPKELKNLLNNKV